jgi:hypothetical protein
MTMPLLVLVGGLVFAIGFALGSAVFALVLRQRERQLSIKIKAVESARRYLHRHGVHLSAWVASAIDQEREIRIIKRPRRWSSWWQRRNLGRRARKNAPGT